MDSYRTIQESTRAQLQRERSRFIAIATPIENRNTVASLLQAVEQEFSDATHHCYAYRLIEKEQITEIVEDAGEPLGSAGKPILQVLHGRDLVNTIVVVVRYFGGVKLGIGGLARAYSDATKLVLDAVAVIERIREIDLIIKYPYSMTGEVMRTIHRFNVRMVKIEYSDMPQAWLRLAALHCDTFQSALRDATRGQVELLERML